MFEATAATNVWTGHLCKSSRLGVLDADVKQSRVIHQVTTATFLSAADKSPVLSIHRASIGILKGEKLTSSWGVRAWFARWLGVGAGLAGKMVGVRTCRTIA